MKNGSWLPVHGSATTSGAVLLANGRQQTLTLLPNIFININLIDVETGYKTFKAPLIKSMRIKEEGFGVEPDIIAKLARTGCRIYKVRIFYSGRTHAKGKKINWKDGLGAIYAMLKCNLSGRPG